MQSVWQKRLHPLRRRREEALQAVWRWAKVKRVVALFSDGNHVNFPADRLVARGDDDTIEAYNGVTLVGVFDRSSILRIYISEKEDGRK